MPLNKPNIASLALDLDGCRFGDSPPRRSNSKNNDYDVESSNVRRVRDSHRNHHHREENQNPNRHPVDDDDERQREREQHSSSSSRGNCQGGPPPPLGEVGCFHDDEDDDDYRDPLSTHHRDHRPQYNASSISSSCSPSSERHHHSRRRRRSVVPPSPMGGGTYRADGLSIGRSFLRFEGSTLGDKSTRWSADDLDVVGCVGRGACSSVWKAKRRRKRKLEEDIAAVDVDADVDVDASDKVEEKNDDGGLWYALKVFPLRDPARRSMLVRELKLLCAFRCDCIVEMEGAFLDNDDDDDRNGGSGDCSVTLVLEYMDRGSLSDLISCDPRGGHGSGSSSDGDNESFVVVGSPVPPRERDFIMPATPETPRALSSPPLLRALSPPSSSEKKKKHHHRMEAAIPEHAIAAIAYQMLWGLGFLHFEGVLHRDVKPANVLVSSNGRVKLADFGIVSRRHPGPPSSCDGSMMNSSPMNHTVVGTTRYMSPERLRGRPYAKPSDVWSAGLVLLEMCRGNSPFEDVTSVIELVQTLDECKMGEYIPDTTSDGLREILLGCLDRSPRNRMPASVLLSSPWFESHGINDVEDASTSMKAYLDGVRPPS